MLSTRTVPDGKRVDNHRRRGILSPIAPLCARLHVCGPEARFVVLIAGVL